MTRERVLVVADDLTGAVDAGHELARRGCATTVAVGATPRGETPARAVTTDSRRSTPGEARAAVSRAVRTGLGGGDRPYVKVDSTLRGPVAATVDAALAAAGRERAAVAPAFPDLGRVTAGGHHLVDGRLVATTDAGDDPTAPATAHLPTLVAAGHDRSVRWLSAAGVARGSGAVRRALDAPGLLVADAVHDAHLAAVAEGAPPGTVLVGSAGLARHLPLPATADRVALPEVTTPGPRPLAVVGSLAPATLAAVRRVPAARRIRLDPADAATDPATTGAAAGRRAARRLSTAEGSRDDGTPDEDGGTRGGGPRTGVVVTSATRERDARAALAAGRAVGLGGAAVRGRVATALATAAATVVDAGAATDLLLSGGAVARAVLDALGAEAVALAGRALDPGVPVGRVVGGDADGLAVVTKAGGFGAPGGIANWLAGRA
jgi:uncharacterized protein YgbK (DUF1537 family)